MIGGVALTSESTPVGHGRLVGNTLVQLVPPAVRIVLGLLLVAALSRYLGVAGFGQYALVFAYVAAFSGVLTDWGLGTVCLREISRHPDQRGSLVVSCATLQALIAVGSYVVMVVSLTILHYPQAVNHAIVLYGLTLLLTPVDLLALPFVAELRLSKLLAPSLLGTVLNFAIVMAAIALHGPLVVLASASLVSLAAQYAWTTGLSLRVMGGVPRPTRAYWGAMLREAWPLGLSTVISTALQQAPLLALSLFSLEGAGLFNAANKIPQQLILVALAVRTTAFPLLSASWVHDRPRFRRQLQRLVNSSLLVAVPGSVVAVGMATTVMRVIFGPAFSSAAFPFALLVLVFALMFPGILMGEALIAAGFQRLSLVIQGASLPLLLVLLAMLIPAHGAAGAAMALVCCYALIVLATAVVGWTTLGVESPLVGLLQGMVALGLGLFTVNEYAGMSPVLGAVLGGFVSFAALAALNPRAFADLRSVLWFQRGDVRVAVEWVAASGLTLVPKPRMRVALVYPIPYGEEGLFGGGERYALELGKAMARRTDTVLVTIGRERRSSQEGDLRVETYPWIALIRGRRQNPLAFTFLKSLRTVDVVHCLAYSTLLTDLSVLFARLTGKRVFITDVGGGADVTLSRLCDLTRLAHGLLLISKHAMDEFQGAQRVRQVIYGGVDTDRYRPGIVPRERRVLFVGRLLPHKGVNYLIDAVDSTIPLTVAGRPYDEQYFRLLQHLAVGKDVTFVTDATDDEIIRLYQTCAVSVLPSVHRTVNGDYSPVPELLGFALMEAMACATPVICTDAGSLPEIVTDGLEGFVVPPNAPDAIRDRLRKLLDDPVRAREMGAQARDTILRDFTWPRIVDCCLDAYEAGSVSYCHA